jgi:hypothetical protein
MRIVTWNCNGEFRHKFHLLEPLGADVIIIQECEEPTQSAADYYAWAGHHLWTGANKTKGLGIFAKRGHSLDRLNWPDNGAALFLPCRVNNEIEIIGVWTELAKSAKESPAVQLYTYLSCNHLNFGEKTMLVGDFKSNSRFNSTSEQQLYAFFVENLKKLGISSLQNYLDGGLQASDTTSSSNMQRMQLKPFHQDYAFAHADLVLDRGNTYWVGDSELWLKHSNQVPKAFKI